MNESGGYKKDKYTLDLKKCNVSKDFICPICYQLFVKATELKGCGHTYCKDCITRWGTQSNQCPMCKKDFYSFDMTSSLFVDRFIGKTEVECSRCDWKGVYSDYLKHVTENDVIHRCVNMLVPCILCNDIVKSEFMEDHKKNKCSYRDVECELCKLPIKLAEKESHLLYECSEIVTNCPNKECEYSEKRKFHIEHLLTCAYQEIECSFSYLGCIKKFERKAECRHMIIDSKKHLELSMLMMKDIMKDNRKTKEENNRLKISVESWKLLCSQQTRMIDNLSVLHDGFQEETQDQEIL